MMTNEEIKKGLELCKANWCVMCPYSNCIGCEGFLKQDALTLITKQEQEIERLNSHNGFLQSVISHNKDMLDEAVKQAKIDVLNELIDKMFEREYMGVKYKERIFYESDIDDMIAEVQNAEDKS